MPGASGSFPEKGFLQELIEAVVPVHIASDRKDRMATVEGGKEWLASEEGQKWVDDLLSNIVDMSTPIGMVQKVTKLSKMLKQPKYNNIFYRGTNSGETQRIPEVFTAAKGKTFVARTPSSAKNYGDTIERIEAKPTAKIIREEEPSFWRLIGRRKPGNGWIGSATRKGETVIDAVNDAIRKAEDAGYDIISFSSDSDIGTIILNESAVIRNLGR